MWKNWKSTVLLGALLTIGPSAFAQFNTLGTVYGRTNSLIQGVAIGNITTAPTPNIALWVRGDLTPISTGEVFRSDAPGHANSYWRMLHIGTEYGSLYHLDTKTEFNINANAGALLFRTNDKYRMWVNPTITYPTLSSFTNIPAAGFVAITPDVNFFNNGPGPFSRLHLAEGSGDNAQAFGYRLWERNGITFTGNGDQGYIGPKYGATDVTDMVIQWSDNPGFAKADRMRFIFTSLYQTSPGARMNTLDGLEAMRLWPQDGNNVNVGIGDFAVGGDDPTERLDVRTGRVRIRQLPTDPDANDLTKILVVDDVDPLSDEYGVVKWRDASTLGGDNCKWTLQGLPGSNSDISTAYALNTGCPQEDKGVGIGLVLPKAKLHVVKEIFSDSQEETAIKAETRRTVNGQVSYGVDAHNTDATPNASYNIAVKGTASNSRLSYGIYGLGTAEEWQSSNCFGVYGEATADNTSDCFGVFGRASNTNGTGGPGGEWAGYFDGDVMIDGDGYYTGMTPILSDSSLKTNVEDLEGADELLAQLHPKTYDFLTAEHPHIHLPAGQQMGLIAQEVEDVLPNLVKQVTIPAMYDSTGTAISEPETVKALNYVSLIPLLIAGYQEQQQRMDAQAAQLTAQADQLSALADQLAQCCSASGDTRSLMQNGAASTSAAGSEALRIDPNPFNEGTTLTYTVPAAGRVRLEVSTADGRPLKVLREEETQSGTFTYSWNTESLASGTYLVSLLLDTKVVVKKAVKVDR